MTSDLYMHGYPSYENPHLSHELFSFARLRCEKVCLCVNCDVHLCMKKGSQWYKMDSFQTMVLKLRIRPESMDCNVLHNGGCDRVV